MCQQEADETDFAQGSGATGVPCRETEKSVEQIDGHSENSCLQPAECAASREDVGRRGSERDPSEQVKSQAVAREQRVHRKGSVLDFQTAEDDSAGNHQHFDVGIRGITTTGGARLIFDSTENGRAAKGHLPVGGNANFHSAEDSSDGQSGFTALYAGLGEIQLDAAKNGGDLATLKILAGHEALPTAEDDGLGSRSAGIPGCGCGIRRTGSP